MTNHIEYTVYEGDEYSIEWYFDDKQQSEALDYFNSLSKDEKIQLLKLVKRMGDAGIIKDITKFRHEGDKIYAFKPKPDRFLCFFTKVRKLLLPMASEKNNQNCRFKKRKMLWLSVLII